MWNTKLVVLSGKKGSGKTTAETEFNRAGFVSVAFADPLRAVVQTLFRLSDEQCTDPALKESSPGPLGVTYRRGMQVVGTDIVREGVLEGLLPELAVSGRQFWVEHACQRVDKLLAEGASVVVTDARFPEEIDAVLARKGAHMHIKRDPAQLAEFYERNGWDARDAHASEACDSIVPLGTAHLSLHIKNDDTLDAFRAKIREAIERWFDYEKSAPSAP